MTFLGESNFKPLSDLEKYELNFKGLYALRIADINILPSLFKDEMITSPKPIIYIGKGERTLNERLKEECRGISHATFFRGIGALLNYKSVKGSLIGKKNKNNYKFGDETACLIIDWMNSNLYFNFIRIDNNLDKIEKELIVQNYPILNTKHNPMKSKLLALKRKECREYALCAE
jgi:hypothetical protein